MEKEFALSLIKEHFELECSLEELDEDLNLTILTSKRLRFDKSSRCCDKAFQRLIDYYVAKKTGEEFVTERNISSILARVFIIYENENEETTIRYIKRTYPNRYDFFEFEKINEQYLIAYD
jgi:hypothetical protein